MAQPERLLIPWQLFHHCYKMLQRNNLDRRMVSISLWSGAPLLRLHAVYAFQTVETNYKQFLAVLKCRYLIMLGKILLLRYIFSPCFYLLNQKMNRFPYGIFIHTYILLIPFPHLLFSLAPSIYNFSPPVFIFHFYITLLFFLLSFLKISSPTSHGPFSYLVASTHVPTQIHIC